jgi:hypothetical protein
VVARNRSGPVLERSWPVLAHEPLTSAPPIAAGGRLYLSGEAYLYSMDEK